MNVGPASPSIAVIGVGNDYRGDDGVGWAVVARLRESARLTPLPRRIALSTCDAEPARLLSLWEGVDASIVIDAARTSTPEGVGRVRRFALDETLPQPGTGATSSHGLGLAATIELARALDRLPRILIVYAVEGGEFGFEVGLSAAVRGAVESTARLIEHDIARLRSFAPRD